MLTVNKNAGLEHDCRILWTYKTGTTIVISDQDGTHHQPALPLFVVYGMSDSFYGLVKAKAKTTILVYHFCCGFDCSR